MRTIPAALTWELLTRERWQLLLMTCIGSVIPLLLYTALRYHGAIEVFDSAFIVMHITMVQINVFVFGAGVMTSLGPIKRLYTYPARTSTLVTWQLVPAMVLVGLEVLLTSLVLNTLFDVQWPLLGPSLFAAVSFSAVVAILWLTERTAWLPWAVGLVAAALGLWFKTRHGPFFDHPTHYWTNVTLADAATLVGIALVAHVVAVYGVSRQRRGEPLPAWGLVAWCERILNSGELIEHRFASPAEAQLWYEWRKKGWVMPGCVTLGLIVGGIGWLIFSRNLGDLVEGLCFAGGVAVPVVGMLGGLVLGNSGLSDSNYAMGPFLSTRPMTSKQYAQLLLWTAAKSVVYTWLLWAVPAVLLYVTLLMTGNFPMLTIKPGVGDWWWTSLPGALLGPWMISTCLAATMLTGRSQTFVLTLISLFFFLIAMTGLTDYFLTPDQRAVFWQSVAVALSLLFTLGTVLLFRIAGRRQMIDAPTVWGSLATFLLLVAAVSWGFFVVPNFPWVLLVCLIGAASLVVAPLAGTPLALAWNRTR